MAAVTPISGIGQPDWVSIAGSSAWAAGVDPGIGRFELATGKQGSGVPSGVICLAMDVAFDSLWAGDCDHSTLLRIDPKTGRIQATIPLPGPPTEETSVAAGEGSVWLIVGGPPRLVRIDPKTNLVSATVKPTTNPSAMRAGVGGLWLVSSSGTVVRLDAKTGAPITDIPVGRSARFSAIGADSLWVMNQSDGTVSRIDGASSKVIATIVVSGQSIEGGDMAFGGGFAWARVSDALVAQIDPATNKVTRRLGNPAGSGSVAADDDAVWISAHDVSTLWRVPLK